MTTQEIATMVASIGLPYAYYQFPDGTGTEPPFLCFMYTGDNDFKADGKNYQKIEHLVIELYTDNKDFALEATVEGVLDANGMVWTRGEEWLDSEKMCMVVYGMDVVITEDTNNTEVLTNGE